MKEQYAVSVKISRKGQRPFDQLTFRTDDYEDDEQFCQAVASQLMETIREDREYLETVETA